MDAKNDKSCRQAFVDSLFTILTFSYSGAYKHHTLQPIQKVQEHQNDTENLISALATFHGLKSEELKFVATAATLSAAAVIGVFSWHTSEKEVWAARMLWNWSFFMSSFALISSAHQRLLRHLPKDAKAQDYDEERLAKALTLFLQPPGKPRLIMKPRRISSRMLWVWQCPTMLMNFSWVFFLVGYALHILNPIFDQSQAGVSPTVSIITVIGCCLVVLNFVFCAALCQHRLEKKAAQSSQV